MARSKPLRAPAFLAQTPSPSNFDPFTEPHYMLEQAQQRIHRSVREGLPFVLFGATELRVFNSELLEVSSLTCRHPMLPARHTDACGAEEDLIQHAEMGLFEGLLFWAQDIPVFTARDWQASKGYFHCENAEETHFPTPLIPLLRLGRIRLSDRLRMAKESLGA